jgi:two-component system cell cycle sensor histidine kinase/response regulator CckA
MKTTFASTETASRPCWMIVDDNVEILSLMREIVTQFSDAEIVCFNSPRAALAAFEAAPDSFELVITDFEMPGMNGVELCHRLLAISPTAKVLLATGSGMVTEEAAAGEGFCGLLHKPFPFAALQRALAAAGLLEIPAENNSKKIAALTMA